MRQLFSMLFRNSFVQLFFLLLVSATGTSTRAETTLPEYQLAIAGNDRIAWLMIGIWDDGEKEFIQRFSYIDPQSRLFRQAVGYEPQIGRITHSAVVEDHLRVFLRSTKTKGTHYRYGKYDAKRESRLPDSVEPLAIAGEQDVKHPNLWAVVDAKTADMVEVEWSKILRQRATTKRGEKTEKYSPPIRPLVYREPDTCHLIRYYGIDWQPRFCAPKQVKPGDRIWFCIIGNQHHFFWQNAGNNTEIFYACRIDEQWIERPHIPLSGKLQTAAVGTKDKQPCFAALVKSSDTPNKASCLRWSWLPDTENENAGKWEQQELLKDGKGNELIIPLDSAIGFCGEYVAIIERTEQHFETGLWPLEGGMPAENFRQVPMMVSEQKRQDSQVKREILSMVMMVSILLLVFWQRQPSITNPVVLPANLQIVNPAKRAISALIDIAPAAIVIYAIYHESLSESIKDFQLFIAAAKDAELAETYEMPKQLHIIWFYFLLIYTSYCTLFEIFMRVTPGKRLLGFHVLSESLTPPNFAQIIIRNLSRIIELLPYLQIWPFLMVVLFTRNRQRIGDLLARTIVVEHPSVIPPANADMQE